MLMLGRKLEKRLVINAQVRTWRRMMSENDQRTRLSAENGKGRSRSQREQALQTEVESRLRKSGYPDLHRVSCDLCDGVLTLRGRVSTFYLKQVAQTLIGQRDEIRELDNRLMVIAPPGSE